LLYAAYSFATDRYTVQVTPNGPELVNAAEELMTGNKSRAAYRSVSYANNYVATVWNSWGQSAMRFWASRGGVTPQEAQRAVILGTGTGVLIAPTTLAADLAAAAPMAAGLSGLGIAAYSNASAMDARMDPATRKILAEAGCPTQYR
jgi:hypothetical protein